MSFNSFPLDFFHVQFALGKVTKKTQAVESNQLPNQTHDLYKNCNNLNLKYISLYYFYMQLQKCINNIFDLILIPFKICMGPHGLRRKTGPERTLLL